MLYSSVNTIWVLLGAALVFFMQAGFAMCEAGFTRAKNAGNMLMKNLMDLCIGTPLYWLLGFGIMFGAGNAVFGHIDPFITKDYSGVLPAGVPLWAFAIFQSVFCATAATIVAGAMAERTKFSAYCIYSAVISMLIYPITGHWIWGGGWLAKLGFHDFAGSTAVHMVGGVCSMIGAAVLGPRIGKYGSDGKPRAIIGHNLPIAALGVFILWFCWFGFNGASTVGMDSDSLIACAGRVFYNTNLAAAVATVAAMILTWIRYGKPDVSMTFNASLAGLVGITAGCDAVAPGGAAAIGLVCGIAVVAAVEFFDKIAKIDDPVGAISVHGVCGLLGTVLTGFFATGATTPKGVFYGGGFGFAGIQLLGTAAVALWTAGLMAAVFLLIKKAIGLRADAADEIMGLDTSEHGLYSSYAGFIIMQENPAEGTMPAAVPAAQQTAAAAEAAFAEAPERTVSPSDFTGVRIICRPSALESLKNAMNKIGITGMTVSNVMGYGAQKGRPEFYRGTPVEVTLLPKVQVDIVVNNASVAGVVEAARGTLCTGHIGDGKIFITDVENVIRIRTGEEGSDALQSG
ncbi:MAG: ammonium transporter [Abditibacteriota bacterium]|nr:ammonium transporter [Abditibacteriota bacterium]